MSTRLPRPDADSDAEPSTYRELPPPPYLAHVVACLWTREHDPGAPDTRVVPDGCVDVMWVANGGDARLQVAGPDTRGHLTTLAPGGRIDGVRLAPGAGAAALGLPLHALRDTRPDLADVWDDTAADVATDMVAAAGESGRALALARALAARTPAPSGPAGATSLASPPVSPADGSPEVGDDPAMRHVASVLGDSAARVTVRDLAWDLGLSERQLHRRCTVAFGYGPKTLHRVLRFQAALAMARAGVDLARVAHECGYADQPHLAREVADLAGVPMTTLLAA